MNAGDTPRPRSAGLLMFQHRSVLECFLVHPGGPFFAKKNEGVWTIPKGEIEPGEAPRSTLDARVESSAGGWCVAGGRKTAPSRGADDDPRTDLIPLGTVQQRSGKVVAAWAFEGD